MTLEYRSKIRTDGLLTIPKTVRHRLKLKEGDWVQISLTTLEEEREIDYDFSDEQEQALSATWTAVAKAEGIEDATEQQPK